MTVNLIYPPCCDPTAPYISLPVLTGYLRSRGVTVNQLDANAGGFQRLLCGDAVHAAGERVKGRLSKLDGEPFLAHPEALEYAILAESLRDWKDIAANGRTGTDGAERLSPAVAVMKHPEDFYNFRKYADAADIIENALALVSAAYYPLRFSFSGYRKPFSLLNPVELTEDAKPENNPFDGYYREVVLPWIKEGRPDVFGISVAFSSQLQQAWCLAALLRQEFPDLSLVLGGSAATQFFLTMPERSREEALRPFDAAVLFEGEEILYDIVADAAEGRRPPGIIEGKKNTDLAALPPPDFEGLDMSAYLSPEPVLPYDAARGCYWGRCAFCHYGLTDQGTAAYRERGGRKTADDLSSLARKYGCRIFYLSEDTISPRTLREVSGLLASATDCSSASIRWATDIRAEKSITPEIASALKNGGCLALSVGLESGSERVLNLIGKGIHVSEMEIVIGNLADAGIAVELMCFSNFPTETYWDAMETVSLIKRNISRVSLFMFGEWKLTAGSLVARNPEDFGIRELYHMEGDGFHGELFFVPVKAWKTEKDLERLDRGLYSLSGSFTMKPYPWVGSLSTAHTLLWYEKFGPDIFRRLTQGSTRSGGGRHFPDGRKFADNQPPAYDASALLVEASAREDEIWREMLMNERRISRKAYTRLAAAYAPIRPALPDRRGRGQKVRRRL